jgi:hypothetical protein
VRTANARDTAIVGLHGLRTTDYGLLAVRRSWEVLGSPILIVYRGSRTRSVEHDQGDQSSHSPLLSIYLLLYATTRYRNTTIKLAVRVQRRPFVRRCVGFIVYMKHVSVGIA